MIFLRPWALLLMIIPFFMKGLKHFTRTQTPWTKFIDKALLPALLVQTKAQKLTHIWNIYMWGLWILWTIALAGPAFYKLPTPATQSAPNTIIVFDLSMQGKELLQGQAKLYDLLSALRGERVGLVVFGQDRGYTAMPMTPDIFLIKEIVPTLTGEVLPEPATNPEAGFEYAASLLDHAGGKGRILYITNNKHQWHGRYPFGILDLKERTADDSDIQKVLASAQKADASSDDTTFSTTADVWADLGGWLILASLPIVAFIFRKGLLFLILFFMGMEAQAGFLWRPDQEIYHTEKKAVEAYHNREYTTASHLFQQTGNFYNLGNALAFSGDIQGAIQAYTKELEKNPNNQDAQFNKEYLEKQLPPPEASQQQNEDGQSENNKNESEENSEQTQKEEQQDGQEQNEHQQDTQNTSNENQSDTEQNQPPPQQEEKRTQEFEQNPTQDETQAQLEKTLVDDQQNYNQEEQQIINRLNHDPSRVLRYRLLLQHQKGLRQ